MLNLIRHILLFLFFSTHAGQVLAQGISGRLTDADNNPVPFAAIYDETSFTGTTSNTEGYFDLKLEPGQHSIVFKAMGYFVVRRQVAVSDKVVSLNIQMVEQTIRIEEVVITPGKEDPAYAIMRKVIGLAPYHLNQVKEYTADVYLRGIVHLIKIPNIIARHAEIDGRKNVLKNGDVFLQESVNQIRFQAPERYDQMVISYHNTFPGESNDVNPMEIIRTSFYQPKVDEFISPLAPNAFTFYKYRYEGFFEENGNVVFKIMVTPKRNSQQLMKGQLYVVERLWCLHSADVSVHMFFGDLRYKTIYSPVMSNAWLPISYEFHVEASIMGIKADYKYTSSVKFQQVILNDKDVIGQVKIEEPAPEKDMPETGNADTRMTKNQQDIEKLMAKEELTNRDMVKLSTLISREARLDTSQIRSLEIKDNPSNVTVEKDALKKDTAYWNKVRPVPLTSDEIRISEAYDSTLASTGNTLKTSDTAKTAKPAKKLGKFVNFLTSGAGFRVFDSTLYIKYDGLVGLKKFDFNTVDGFIYRQTFRLEQKIDSVRILKIYPGIAYGFNRQKVMWWTDIGYDYAFMNRGYIRFHIGSESEDYNSETGINPTINTIASLFFRRNYLKLYQLNQAYLSNSIDPFNGLNLFVKAGYRISRPLANHTDYSFFYRNERDYTPNIPTSDSTSIARNIYHEEAYWEARLEYTPQYYYRIRNGRKHYQHSKYPTFYLLNRMAIPGIINATANYDLLEAGIRQHKEWGMMHAFYWEIKGGVFLSNSKIYLMNDKYFNNQDLPVNVGSKPDVFRLLPYYRYATNDRYTEAHIRFTTPYLAIKYLPFLSSKLWSENLYLNYLTGSQVKNYWEVGYSISQIYMMGSVGIFAGFKGKYFQSFGLQVIFDL
jgi:hypothetical protein